MENQDKEAYSMVWQVRDETVRSCSYDFLSQGKYTDCVLSASGSLVHCHQIVIASCSPYLDSLLESSQPGDKTTLIFADIKVEDLLLVLTYMYTGQVQVPAEQLGSFVSTVSHLQVKGFNAIVQLPSSKATDLNQLPVIDLCGDDDLPAPVAVKVAEEAGLEAREHSDDSKVLTTLTVVREEEKLGNAHGSKDQPEAEMTQQPSDIQEASNELDNTPLVKPTNSLSWQEIFEQSTASSKAKKQPTETVASKSRKTDSSLEIGARPRTRRQSVMPSRFKGFDLNKKRSGKSKEASEDDDCVEQAKRQRSEEPQLAQVSSDDELKKSQFAITAFHMRSRFVSTAEAKQRR